MKLSIVIPASGNQSDIDDTLVSILENRPSNCEVLLVHSPTYVDPYELADEIRLVEAPQGDYLSLLNAGFAAAEGQIVHSVSPGLTVAPQWCDAAIEAFDEDSNLGALAPTLNIASTTPHCGVRYHVGTGKKNVSRSDARVLAPSIHSGFYLRTAWQFMRGYDVRYGEFADVELGLRMYSANYRSMSCADVQLDGRIVSVQPSVQGFHAGKIRACLFHQAKAFGLASSQAVALFSEPFRNGLGIGMLTSFVGRLVSKSMGPIRKPSFESVSESTSHRRAA